MNEKPTGSQGPESETSNSMTGNLHSNLAAIYKFLRENYQKDIDAAFDNASQQIGFITATTMPVIFEVGDDRSIKNIRINPNTRKGKLYEKEISSVLESISKDTRTSTASPGTYNLVLPWYDLLNARLGTDWMEPVRLQWEIQSGLTGTQDRSRQDLIALDSYLITTAINEAYPELRLRARP
jgi:hypothetical protein